MHKPIQFKNISLSFPHKTCFEDFNTQINYGSRIAIIGRNGSGKSTLLKILQGNVLPTNGVIKVPDDAVFGYVPQAIDGFEGLSGGQRLNASLTAALSLYPNILLLDEPTNHFDHHNRKSLLRMLRAYTGTLIVVSHDTELLNSCVDTLWHIDDNTIKLFSGNYHDYISEITTKRASVERELSRLNRERKDMHQCLMQEQLRAAKSRTKGAKNIEQRKWPTIVSKSKALRAEETSGRKQVAIDHKKQELNTKLAELYLPEVIIPKFSLTSADIGEQNIITVSDGTVGYQNQEPILQNISLLVGSKDIIALCGNNGSGKSTLVKAILADQNIVKSGNWHVPKPQNIGYLDQNYATLRCEETVFNAIMRLVPNWSYIEIRDHLNNFLFRKNIEVDAKIEQLSGGEKARLCLAQIAANTPKLLILDEITNNLDLETREHMIQVLLKYPGALLVISHDEDFIRAIKINDTYTIQQQTIFHNKNNI